jgi:predicted nucleotidyltransferase
VENWTARKFEPSELVQALVDGGVEFVIVGGVAVVLHGMPRFTKDLDICYALDADNLDRLGNVLVNLGAKLRGVPDEVPFVPDGKALRRTEILTLETPEGAIDLLVHPDGAPEYETLRKNATTMELADRQVQVASIDDLIAMKRTAGRPQDLTDVEALEVAARERTSSADRSQGT